MDDMFDVPPSTGLADLFPEIKDTPKSNEPEPRPASFWNDFGRAVASGAYGVAKDVGGAGEFIAGEGGASTRLKEFGQKGNEAWVGSMSERGQRDLRASVLPGVSDSTIWDEGATGAFRAIATKAGASLPSLVASVIPAGVAARLLGAGAGVVAGGVAGGAMSGGSTYEDIQSDLRKVGDIELQNQNDYYYALRSRGMSEADARKELETLVIGAKPLVIAGITALTSRFGVEGLVARGAAGEGVKGVVRGAGRGLVGEGSQEFVESGAQEIAKQSAGVEANISQRDWVKVLDQALQGAIVGGVLGGGTGALTGGLSRTPPEPIDPDAKAALEARAQEEPEQPVTPEVTPPVAAPETPVAPVQTAPEVAPEVAPEAAPEPLPDEQEDDFQVEDEPLPAPEQEVEQEVAPEVVPEVAPEVAPEPVAVAEQPAPEPVPEVAPQPEPAPEVAPEPRKPRILRTIEPEAASEPAPVAAPTPAPAGPKLRNRDLATPVADVVAGYKQEGFERFLRRMREREDAARIPSMDEAIAAVQRLDQLPVRDPRRKKVREEIAALQARVAEAIRQEQTARVENVRKSIGVHGDDVRTERLEDSNSAKARALVRKIEKFDPQQKAAELAVNAFPAASRTETDPSLPLEGRIRLVRKRFENIVARAKELGATVPTEVGRDTPNWLAALRYYEVMSRRLGTKDEHADNSIDTALLVDQRIREGDPSIAAEQFVQRSRNIQRKDGERVGAEMYRADTAQEVEDRVLDSIDNAEEAEATSEVTSEQVRESQLARAKQIAKEREAARIKSEASETQAKIARLRALREAKARAEAPVTPEVKEAPRTPPSEAQKEAGNYKKDHITVQGLPVSIETRKGETRSKRAPGGAAWSVKMPADYGYIKRTTGADGDQVDVYVGPDRDSDLVVLVDQVDADTKKFDEHKALIGFAAVKDATDAYDKGFSDNRAKDRVGGVSVMTMAEFKAWLAQGATKPAAPEVGGSVPPAAFSREERAPREPSFDNEIANAFARTGTLSGAIDLLYKLPARELTPLEGRMLQMLLPALRRAVGDVPVVVKSAQEFMLEPGVVRAFERGRIDEAPLGMWDPETGRIVLNEAGLRDPASAIRLVVHEAMHAVAHSAIEVDAGLRKRVKQLLEFTKLQTGMTKDDFYGLTDEHEFISEAFSNPRFQQLLASTPMPARMNPFSEPEGRSIFGRMIDFIRDAIARSVPGIRAVPQSVLEAAIMATNQISRSVYSGLSFRDALLIRDMTSSLDMDADDLASFAAQVQDPTPAFLTPQGKPRRRAISGWMKSTGFKFAHTEYIVQQGKGLFVDEKGDALAQVWDRLQRVQPESQKLQQESQKLASDYLRWARTNPDEAARLADLMVEATMMNVKLVEDANWTPASIAAANDHLGKDAASGWQARGRLNDMQRRFMALPSQARRHWFAQAEYYRRTHNEKLKLTVRSILTDVAGLSGPDVDMLTTKTLAGTLNADDEKLIGNRTVAKTLSGARALRQMDGVYFPLMRHGNFAVKTRLPVSNLNGGKLDGNTVEFRGTDKAARAAARKFVAGTDVPVSSVRRAFYLKSNGQQVSAEDAQGQDVDVVYRVALQRDGVFFFDSRVDAEKFRTERAAEFEAVSETTQVDDGNWQNAINDQQMAALVKAVSSRTDLSDVQKKMLGAAMRQAATRLLPGNRIQKRNLARRNIVGASTEVGRTLVAYGNASSGYLSRVKFMPEVREGMDRMRQKLKGSPAGLGTMSDIYREMENRISNSIGQPYEAPPLLRNLMTLSFIDKLGSAAYSFVNALQPAMTTMPYLSGKYGAVNTDLQMARALREIGSWRVSVDGIMNTGRAVAQVREVALDTRDVLGSALKRLKNAGVKDYAEIEAMVEYLTGLGVIDPQAGFEINQASLSGGAFERGLARVERVFRQLPAAVEVQNRLIASIATYRLARKSGATKEQAIETTREVVSMTQFVYSGVNSPAFFNKGVFSTFFLQFKKYAFNMLALLHDMLSRAMRGATPQERRVAQRQIAHLLAVQVVMAGALSLPGLELIKLAGIVLGPLLGAGWDDWERWLRKQAEDLMGVDPAEMFLRGLPRAIGMDLSSRLSLADMFLFGEPKNDNREGMEAYMFKLLAGAAGSLPVDWWDAMNKVKEGELLRAFELLFPVKAVADMAKAVRGMGEEKVSGAEAALQAFGIRPASVAREQEKTGDRIAARKDVEKEQRRFNKEFFAPRTAQERKDANERADRRNVLERQKLDLQRQYMAAKTQSERARLVARIREFNRQDGITFRQRISVNSLDEARERARRREMAD